MSTEQMLAAVFAGIAAAAWLGCAFGLIFNAAARYYQIHPLPIFCHGIVAVVATLVWANMEGLL